MIEVLVFARGNRVASAEAEDPAPAIYAGQILHDEALPSTQAVGKLEVGFYVAGKLVRLVTGRPAATVLA